MFKRKPVPTGITPTPGLKVLMPGSFLSHHELLDEIDDEVLHNPWNSSDGVDPLGTLERIQDLVATEASNEQPELRWATVDWRKFDPPKALRKAPNVTSQIILDIVQSSIDNVRRRAIDERRQQLLAEEHSLLAQLEERRAKQKGKEPYLPIIMVEDEALPASSSTGGGHLAKTQTTANDMITATGPRPSDESSVRSYSASDLAIAPFSQKLHKSRESAIRRLFKRNTEKGESSAEGSAREGLLQRLMDSRGSNSSKTPEQTTEDAVAKLKKRLKAAQQPEITVECVSCLEDLPSRECIRVQCHEYCKDCFVRLISTACENETQWPPKCCLNNISFALIRKNIPSALKKTFNERSSEWDVPIAERIYCWRTDCGLFIRPNKIKSSTNAGQCDRGHWTCANCRNESHGQEDCPMDEAMILTNQIAEDEGWRRCYKCHALVEHSAACQHMTCRCGGQFCYVCGLRWRTCQCTIVDLDNVKAQADERREQRRRREELQDADAEELRNILAQIEEFEREEARQAELRAEEELQAALQAAQERREQELLERVQAESARVRDITIKFRQLRESLDSLHELQSVLLETAQGEAFASQITDGQLLTAQLNEKHKLKREELALNYKAKVSAREHAFAKEYRQRVSMEAKVESDFREQLLLFWGDEECAEAEIETAMLQLQQRMDRRFRSWKGTWDETIRQLKESLGDELTVQEELMWSAEQLLKSRLEAGQRELSEKEIADKKWMDYVVLEREKMISDLELEELEGDADMLEQSEDGEDA